MVFSGQRVYTTVGDYQRGGATVRAGGIGSGRGGGAVVRAEEERCSTG